VQVVASALSWHRVSKDEGRGGFVPGSIHLPRGFLEMQIEGKIPDRNTKVVTICAGGVRSLFAATALAEIAL